MKDNFEISLEACNPARNCWRTYNIQASLDLFGHWIIQVRNGRIGAQGRIRFYSAPDGAGAKEIIRNCLKRRASAPKRIGAPYLIRQLHDPQQWAVL